jgi:uncharacterized membrane protein YjfL (UPF0719 family)
MNRAFKPQKKFAGSRAADLQTCNTKTAPNYRHKHQTPMKPPLHRLIAWIAAALLLPFNARAATIDFSSDNWHAKSLGEALLYMVLFAAVGVAMAIAGYKLFDRCTPGDLHKEIIENKNVAAALIGAAVIIGTCIIVAAAMIG